MTAILNGHMREFLASLDESVHLTDRQVEGVIEDLDSWNQSSDGAYQLQMDGQENRARLYTILSERTGLNYQQAPKFFEKAHDLFLDRGIAFEPVAEESAPIEEGTSGAEIAAAGAGSLLLAEPLAGIAGKKDLAAIDNLLDTLKRTEAYWKTRIPLPSFGQQPLPAFDDPARKLSEVRQFREGVEILRAEVVQGAQFLEKAGEAAGQEFLSHADIGENRTILAVRSTTIREMALYYGRNQELRPSDTEALKIILRSSRNVNGLISQWKPSALPPLSVTVSSWRSAFSAVGTRASQSLTALRGMANGAAQFLAPWQARLNAAPRSTIVLAVAGAGVGILAGALGMFAALPRRPHGEVLLVPPSQKPEPKQPEPKPAVPAKQSPPAIPTISVDALPPAPAPARTTARMRREK